MHMWLTSTVSSYCNMTGETPIRGAWKSCPFAHASRYPSTVADVGHNSQIKLKVPPAHPASARGKAAAKCT